jgi:hypothetical protein
MKRYLGISFVAFCATLLLAGLVLAKPAKIQEISVIETGEGLVGDVEGTMPAPQKVLQDTTWIADWSFDGPGGSCTSTGWVEWDNRILNDGSNYWVVDNRFDGTGGIDNKAAVLSKHDLCWVVSDGYGNDWDYSVICKYKGASMLAFNFLSDSEPGYDFVTVETDELGQSESLIDCAVDPTGTPESFRDVLFTTDGLNSAGVVADLALGDYGNATAEHEVYIRFEADGGYSDEDGLYPTFWGAGLVVDSVRVYGGTYVYTEEFEGALNANITLANTAPAMACGEWGRLYSHITDNDKCSENTSCAWLWTDPLKIAYYADMAFGPGSAIHHNWSDQCIASPWADVTQPTGASGTVLSFRRFPGNRFTQGKVVQNWSVRGKVKVDNTDTSTTGDSIDCVSNWGHASSWNSLTNFTWITSIFDMSTYFPATSTEVQVRFRVSDWRYIAGDGPPATLNPGPGPYTDRVRIGRRVLTGPVINIGIDTRYQAQDCFPTVQNAITPGEHFSPDGANRHGTCAFSEGTDLGINTSSTNLITGDSIRLAAVQSLRPGNHTIDDVKVYGAITGGLHQGLAPAPYTVGGNGFFEVTADSCRGSSGVVVAECWFVDFNDFYFRGSDVLEYLWYTHDSGGGVSTYPPGYTSATWPPAPLGSKSAIQRARETTNGLLEVSYLPTMLWPTTYYNRIRTEDPGHGNVAPTQAEIDSTLQKACILYYQHVTSARRSGDTQRTSFMYTLDRMGYRGYYDVYDVQGYGNTNNQLGGRANVAQASGYLLIVEDDGRSNLTPNIPDGLTPDNEKINQAGWYQSYLTQGLTGLVGTASLMVIGENTAFEKATNPLIAADMGLVGIATDQGLNVNPNVLGVSSFSTWDGCSMAFSGDEFSLSGGCPNIRAYDVANAGGTAVITHKYKSGAATSSGGAIIMNKNTTNHSNTIWLGFPWFDIRPKNGEPPYSPPPPTTDEEERLLGKILICTIGINCIRTPTVTGTGDDDLDGTLPKVSALYQNVPNPFNPTTKIKFDMGRDGHVKLQIFDVAGHLVKTVVNGSMSRGRHEAIWTGLDETGTRVASGVYFYQLVTDDLTSTKKMVVLK